jgi:hypothetical protein
MSQEESRQSIIDQEHLKILYVGYAISAGLSALFSLFVLLYAFMASFFLYGLASMPTRPGEEPPPAFLGWLIGAVFVVGFAMLLTWGIVKYVAYKRLKERRSRVFCMIVAGISCLAFPYGTLLGVFTFVVLSRPSVVALFESPTGSGPAG